MFQNLDKLAALYMVIWFTLSCGIALLNKYIFAGIMFVYPLTLTTYHMLGQAVLSQMLVMSFSTINDKNLSQEQYMKSVFPVAAILGIEICFNNVGIRYIPISFVATVRSLTPLCTAIVSRVALGRKLSLNAGLTLILICFGVCLSTYEELSFHLGGFFATLTSCFLTAVKLALTSVLFGDSIKLNPVAALSLMSPVAFAVLAPVAIFLEGRSVLEWLADHDLMGVECMIIFSSAFFAMGLNLSMFFLLKRSNAIAVSIAGNMKVIATIVLSVVVFKNPITQLGVIGCGIALVGCSMYGFVKKKFIN